MTARDELIADWQRCLAAAEALAAESPRFAWLARVRIRLYRFLLACYGAGDWNATPPESSRPADSSAVIFDSADALPLCGKPAKSAGKIQAVLKAVANAQDQPLAPGPLTGGLDPTCWVLVAAANSNLNVGRCSRLLRNAGISSRTVGRGGEWVVEVTAADRQRAVELLQENLQQLRKKTPMRVESSQQIRLRITTSQMDRMRLLLVASMAGGLVMCVIICVVLDSIRMSNLNQQIGDELQFAILLLVFIALAGGQFLAALSIGKMLAARWQPPQSECDPSRQEHSDCRPQ